MERGQLNATMALTDPLGLGSAPRRSRCAVWFWRACRREAAAGRSATVASDGCRWPSGSAPRRPACVSAKRPLAVVALRHLTRARAVPNADSACVAGPSTGVVLYAREPAIGDRPQETSYSRTHDLRHGDGPPCPRSAGHGGGGINSIVVGRAASSQTLASFPVTLFSTSVRELER